MKTELVTPSVSYCSLRIYDSKESALHNYVCDWHMHCETEIFLLTSGIKYFYINNDEILLRPGDIILVNSRIPHKTKTPIGSMGVLLQFRLNTNNDNRQQNIWSEIALGLNKDAYKIFQNGEITNKQLTNCIQKISNEYSFKQKSYEHFIKAYIYEITAILYRDGILTDYRDILKKISIIEKPLKYIDRHYNEHISLNEISELSNCNKSYFCRVFKNILGISFVEYLNLARIYKAKELMKNTKKNITEISFEVGFSSVSYFIKTFKKNNFCTPNKYRSLM